MTGSEQECREIAPSRGIPLVIILLVILLVVGYRFYNSFTCTVSENAEEYITIRLKNIADIKDVKNLKICCFEYNIILLNKDYIIKIPRKNIINSDITLNIENHLEQTVGVKECFQDQQQVNIKNMCDKYVVVDFKKKLAYI